MRTTIVAAMALAASLVTACGGEETPPPAVPRELVVSGATATSPLFAAGGAHTCVRGSGEPLLCWGKNDDGELGDGTQDERATPTHASAVARFGTVALGDAHACGLEDGRVHCWGANELGQLGDETLTSRVAPARVEGVSGVLEIAAGNAHTCARTREGAVYCWGDDTYLQIGSRAPNGPDARETDSGEELVVRPRRVPLPEPAARIFAHASHSCAQLASGALACWGGAWLLGWLGDETFREGREPTVVTDLANADAIALGGSFVCGLFDGRVRCHGENLDGQLGDPASDCCAQPPQTVSVNGLADATAIVAADRHACAIRAGGAVVCWGADLPPHPDAPENEERATSRPRPYIERGAVEIAAGQYHVCARFEDGRVACFGDDAFGQLGDGVSRRVPRAVQVHGIDDATQLAMGTIHTCVQSRAQGVRCWGADARSHVAALDAGSGLAAGIYETCAITGESEATCASRGPGGMQGDHLAGPVRFGFPIAALSGGDGGVCALGRNGEVACAEEYSDAHVIRFDTPPRTARRIQRGAGITHLSHGARVCGVAGASVRCWSTESPMHSGAVAHVEGAPSEISFEAADPPIGVAIGSDIECAWTRGGRALCWEVQFDEPPAPQPVSGIAGVLEMAAGGEHVCARTDRAVHCWGAGQHGQLGGGALARSPATRPVRVVGLPRGVVQIDAAEDRSCARISDGRVFCWGDDENGRLGRDVPQGPRGPVFARTPRAGN